MTIKVGAPGTKTVRFEVGAWYDKKSGYIRLTIPEHGSFHTTVSNNPTSDRYHPNPFGKLKGVRGSREVAVDGDPTGRDVAGSRSGWSGSPEGGGDAGNAVAAPPPRSGRRTDGGAMAKFKINYETSTYDDDKTEEVEADDYVDQGDWITFRRLRDSAGGVDVQQVLLVRGKEVKRIDRED